MRNLRYSQVKQLPPRFHNEQVAKQGFEPRSECFCFAPLFILMLAFCVALPPLSTIFNDHFNLKYLGALHTIKSAQF